MVENVSLPDLGTAGFRPYFAHTLGEVESIRCDVAEAELEGVWQLGGCDKWHHFQKYEGQFPPWLLYKGQGVVCEHGS